MITYSEGDTTFSLDNDCCLCGDHEIDADTFIELVMKRRGFVAIQTGGKKRSRVTRVYYDSILPRMKSVRTVRLPWCELYVTPKEAVYVGWFDVEMEGVRFERYESLEAYKEVACPPRKNS